MKVQIIESIQRIATSQLTINIAVQIDDVWDSTFSIGYNIAGYVKVTFRKWQDDNAVENMTVWFEDGLPVKGFDSQNILHLGELLGAVRELHAEKVLREQKRLAIANAA